MHINTMSYLTLRYGNNVSFKSNSSKMEQKFARLRDKTDSEFAAIDAKQSVAAWNFSINSSPENLKKLKRENQRIHNYYSHNSKTGKKLKEFQKSGLIKSKRLQTHLTYLLNQFNISTNSRADLKKIEQKENEIEKKLNTAERKINGKPITEAELDNILEFSTDSSLREKAFFAKAKAGDIIANDIIELIKMRNDYASANKYNDFFDCEYDKTFEMPLIDLLNLTKKVYTATEKQNKTINDEDNKLLAEQFGISPDRLMRYHKSLNPKGSVSDHINHKLTSADKVIKLALETYKKMGFDIEKMPITMDLLPRQNKETGAFCLDVYPGKDIRVLTNLTGNYTSLLTLMHELGHAVHGARSKTHLSYIDARPSNTIAESVALMMEDVAREEVAKEIVKNEINSGILTEKDLHKDLIKSRISDITDTLFDIEFERELYKNPYQNPKELWHRLMTKYFYDSKDEPLTNRWAINNLLVTLPAYTPSYFLSDLIKVQMYSSIREKFGPLTSNPEVAKYLNNGLFRYGGAISDNELVTKLTNSPISEKSFLKSIK